MGFIPEVRGRQAGYSVFHFVETHWQNAEFTDKGTSDRWNLTGERRVTFDNACGGAAVVFGYSFTAIQLCSGISEIGAGRWGWWREQNMSMGRRPKALPRRVRKPTARARILGKRPLRRRPARPTQPSPSPYRANAT
jgi:hypothetical protein